MAADDGRRHERGGRDHPPSLRAATSAPIRATTSSSARPVVSMTIAPAAGASGECVRSRSRRVALALRLEHGAAAHRRSRARRRCARAGLARVEEHLDGGVRRDDGADVAALGDPVAGARSARAGARRAPRARPGRRRPRRRGRSTAGRADRVGHVAPAEQHALAERDLERGGDLGRACARGPRGSRARRARYIAPLSR